MLVSSWARSASWICCSHNPCNLISKTFRFFAFGRVIALSGSFGFRLNSALREIRFLDFPPGSGILLHFAKILRFFSVVLFLLPLGQVFASLSLPQTFVLSYSGWGTLCHGALRKTLRLPFASSAFRCLENPSRSSLSFVRLRLSSFRLSLTPLYGAGFPLRYSLRKIRSSVCQLKYYSFHFFIILNINKKTLLPIPVNLNLFQVLTNLEW